MLERLQRIWTGFGPRTQAAIIAAVMAVVAAFIGITGGDEAIENACRKFGMIEVQGVRFADQTACTHGPDPKPPAAELVTAQEPSVYRQTDLCPGDGKSGARIHIYVGAPANQPNPTSQQIEAARTSLGYAERMLHESDENRYQKLNYFCATDQTPTIKLAPMKTLGSGSCGDTAFDEAVGALERAEPGKPGDSYVLIGFGLNCYPYGGQGLVMSDDRPLTSGGPTDHEALTGTWYALISGPYGSTLLHELGHNMGAVQPAAPHSTGDGWHCTDRPEVMCYDDGGAGISPSNPMHRQCSLITYKNVTDLEPFDCDHDFWQPNNDSGYFATHYNVADSPLLTRPRRR